MESLLKKLMDNSSLMYVIKGGGIIVLSIVSYYVARFLLTTVVHRFAEKTASNWDDTLIKNGVFKAVAYFAPLTVLFYGIQLFQFENTILLGNLLTVVITICTLILFNRLLNSGLSIYEQYPVAVKRPLKGYVQLVKIFIFIIGGVIAVAIILGVSPWKMVSGVGALTAVLMLVFKDTILSFVASILIATNDLIRKGDWIEMPQFGADGDVIDIALHTVKIQNWDKTIVAVPTNKFLDHSFKNWRGMQETGGRRIKRSILIDQSSIGFLEGEVLDRVKNINVIKDYLAQKEKEIAEYNARAGTEENWRKLTNIGTLRAYVLAYLKNHPMIRQDLTLLVRQLQPKADEGLPLQIYAFTNVTAWSEYESIQADIFDHVLAILPKFGLRAYQRNALVDGRLS